MLLLVSLFACQMSKEITLDSASSVFEPQSPIGEALILPYLQQATPTTISILWETALGLDNHVEWGETASLGSRTVGTIEEEGGMGVLHQVVLNDLMPNKRYYYQAHSEEYVSPIYHFKTPPEAGTELDHGLHQV